MILVIFQDAYGQGGEGHGESGEREGEREIQYTKKPTNERDSTISVLARAKVRARARAREDFWAKKGCRFALQWLRM